MQEKSATGNAMTSTVIAVTAASKHVLDNTGPTAVITYSPVLPVKSNEALTITATFNETLDSAPTIALGTPNALTATQMQASGSGGKVWTYQPAIGTGNGQVTVTLAGSDDAGNPLGTVTGTNFTVDNTGPSVTLAYSDGGSANATGPHKVGGPGDGDRDLHRGECPLRDADPLARGQWLHRWRDAADRHPVWQWSRLHEHVHDPGRQRGGDRDGRCHRHGGQHPECHRPDGLHH